MFEDHPSIEDFEGFLRRAPRPQSAVLDTRVIRHLLAECPSCHNRLLQMGWTGARLERLVQLPSGGIDQMGELEYGLEHGRGYDYQRAFERAGQAVQSFLTVAPPPAESAGQLLAELDLHTPAEQTLLVERDSRFTNALLVEELVGRSHTARYRDPEAMLRWAELALRVASRCAPQDLGNPEKLADLRARAWVQLGNALRVVGRLPEAEEAMAEARRYREVGTGDPILRARLLEQMASLHTFKRRFESAVRTLDEAIVIYREFGDHHALARTMVSKATTLLYATEPEKAVHILTRAIPLIDYEEDPHLLLAACHNLVRCYIDLDRPEQALSLYSETRDLYRELDDSLILLRAQWQEGQLLRDLGRLANAESALLRARKGFVERGLAYEVAVISLDLAAVYVKLGSTEDLKQTVVEAIPILRALQVDRETLAALLQLQQVTDQEAQALDLIRLISSRLEQMPNRHLLK
ncbi:MAG: tetratricopeptide repeat protein [Acidobacteriota bacterium]|nr:tetratricopeptide repeat protein [Acidobacteriota bacterium]